MKNIRMNTLFIFLIITVSLVTAWMLIRNWNETPAYQAAVSDTRDIPMRPVADDAVSDFLCAGFPYANGIPGGIGDISDSRLTLIVNVDRILDNPCGSMPDLITFELTPNTEFVDRILRDGETYRKEMETYRERLKEYEEEYPDDEYAYMHVKAPIPYENKAISVNEFKKGYSVLVYVDDEDKSVAKRVLLEFRSDQW
jgi:hypothetical protein